MATTDGAERALIGAARDYLHERYGAGPELAGLTLSLNHPDGLMDVSLRPGAEYASGATPAPSGTRADILRVLAAADRPVKAIVLASRTGRRYGSHFRSVLSAMCREVPAPITRTSEGYRAVRRGGAEGGAR